eukprot:scaffold20811_cov70-Cyclotella_meneghiniana.AAC.1
MRQAVNLVPGEILFCALSWRKCILYRNSRSDNGAGSRTCEKLVLDSPNFAPISKSSPSKTKGHRQYPPLHKMARKSADAEE